MKRLDYLDGLRGFFLLTMMLSHLVLQNGLWLQKLHFREVMFVESTQGFVFLSGLMFGLMQGRRRLRHGPGAMHRAVASRMVELWLWTVGLIALGLLLRDVTPGGVMAWRNWLGTAPLDDPWRIFGILSLTFQPTFLDILPMYILFMAVSPVMIRWVMAGRWKLAAGLSALVWVACQLDVAHLVTEPFSDAIRASDKQGLRVAFDPMGWQVPFMAGLILGALWAAERIDWALILGPRTRKLALIALLVMLAFAPLRIGTAHGMMPREFYPIFRPFELRTDFGPVYLVNFIAAAFLFGWVAVAGRSDPLPVVRAISAGLHWVFTRPLLCLLGRHSLDVYVWHVLLVYAVRYYDSTWGPGSAWMNTTLALYAIGLMWVPALCREWYRGRLRTS